MKDIPTELLPEKTENDVKVLPELPALDSDCENIALFCREMGLADVQGQYIRNLHASGQSMENLGVTRLTQPTMLFTQQALVKTMKVGQEALEQAAMADKPRFMHAIGYVAEKIAKCAETINVAADEARHEDSHRKQHRAVSFTPAAMVQVNVSSSNSTPQLQASDVPNERADTSSQH